jgi:hypothetical protein
MNEIFQWKIPLMPTWERFRWQRKRNPKDLADYTEDYNRLRAQKARNVGSVELRILTNLSFISGEHWVGTQNRMLFTRRRDPNKLHLVFNLAAQMLHPR